MSLLPTLTFILCLLTAFALAEDYDIDLCNHDPYHPTPHLNPQDKGTISAAQGVVDSTSCDIILHGCDVCRFAIQVEVLQLPPCDTYPETSNKTVATCSPSCSHLLIYDVAYQEVTSEWYFRFNESATYTSLSSRLVFRLCMSSRYRPRDVKVRLKFEVQRKEESFSGSSLEPPTWSTFQSPNFPNGYALRGERFIYSFHNLDPGGVIHVVFEDWDLTPMSRILAYEGQRPEGEATEFYGASHRPVLVSKGPDLVLVFQADVYIEHRLHYMGFRARYTFTSGRTSTSLPSTDCGGHTRHSVGGVVTLAPDLLQDCVWVVSVESPFQWLELRLRATVINSTEGDWTLVIKEGMTSSGNTLSSITPSQSRSVLSYRSLFSHKSGLYVHFTGRLHSHDQMSFTYLSYNTASNGSCADRRQALCDRDHCIDRYLVCDGEMHCTDGGDEPESCFYGATTHASTPNILHSTSASGNNPCNEKQILCKDGRHCVPARMLCDDLKDCPDGSDESDCTPWKDPFRTRALKRCCQFVLHGLNDNPGCPCSFACRRSDRELRQTDGFGGAPVISLCMQPYSSDSSKSQTVVCGGEFVPCDSADQCVATSQLCDNEYQCLDRSDELNCGVHSMRTGRRGLEISLSIVLPVCLVVFLVLCLILALRMRKYPKGCATCSLPGGRLLQLSRSTSGASTLLDPLASPPPYEDALRSYSPRSVSEVSATTEFSPLPVIVEPDSPEHRNSHAGQHRQPSGKPAVNFDFQTRGETGIS